MAEEKQEYIERTEKQVARMLDLYFSEENDCTEMYDDINADFPRFISDIAFEKKASLRDLFRKHPAWNEYLQSIIVRGVNIYVDPKEQEQEISSLLEDMEEFFDLSTMVGNFTFYDVNSFIISVFKGEENYFTEEVAGRFKGVYHKGKKPSKMARTLFEKLPKDEDLYNARAFEQVFAQLSDILNGRENRKEDIFVSINPAHILSQSNPKVDGEGMLTSCHSLNSLEYEYNAGATGYVNDEVTFIMFTISDSDESEKSYYRKTSRMFGHYKQGVLMTSRLYTCDVGTCGKSVVNDSYRRVAQEVIATCLGVPNKWSFKMYNHYETDEKFKADCGFGGYHDWQYPDFTPYLSKLKNYDIGGTFNIGGKSICMGCLKPNNEYCLCKGCRHELRPCDDCGTPTEEENLTFVDGEIICSDCLNAYYTRCKHCNDWTLNEGIIHVEGRGDFCRFCADHLFTLKYCDECIDAFIKDDLYYYPAQDEWYCKNCGEHLGLTLVKLEGEDVYQWVEKEEE